MMVVSVLYKLGGERFDHDYYMGQHIPMVRRLWEPLGLRRLQVLRGTGTVDGTSPMLDVMALLEWDDMPAFQKAAAAHGPEILGDIRNFTAAQAVLQFNDAEG